MMTGQYQSPDGMRAIATRPSIVQIKDAKPVTLQLRRTANGPILPGHLMNLGSITPSGHAAAISWTALAGDDTTPSAMLGLMQAESVEAGLRAARDWHAPSQNLSLADAENIAMQLVGTMPRAP